MIVSVRHKTHPKVLYVDRFCQHKILINILRQALQNFVFLVSKSDLEKREDLFRFAKVFTKYFHIVHIVGCRVESCMIYRRVLVESTSHSFFILLEPKYRFRLQKGVKNEDENHFKILNTN